MINQLLQIVENTPDTICSFYIDVVGDFHIGNEKHLELTPNSDFIHHYSMLARELVETPVSNLEKIIIDTESGEIKIYIRQQKCLAILFSKKHIDNEFDLMVLDILAEI